MKTASGQGALNLIFAPAFLLIGLLFVLPLSLFFFQSAAEAGGLLTFLNNTLSIALSPTVQNALGQTFFISAVVTLLALLLAYPVAFYLTIAPGRSFSLVILCVIVPYFTSVIVRTYSWMVLLGRQGVFNQFLMQTGLIDQPLPLLYNQTGILIGMTYVMLPYMVLTLFAAMKRIDLNLLRAAEGLGASGPECFLKVYLPLSMHGIVSGALIVFMLCLGFFVTPALMGGPGDVMIAMLIQHQVEIAMNWSNGAAMALLLFAATMVLYVIYYRISDIDKLMGR